MLQVGDLAPLEHSLENQDGEIVHLASYKGSYIVLYFYPKDETPGCTKEACEFRDATEQLKNAGALVLGVSKDTSKSHSKFATNHQLTFPLLADTNLELQKAFGVWVEKSMYGKTYFGTQRATFLIDPQGMIVFVWPKVKPAGHAIEVLNELTKQTHSAHTL